jgi:hypothetical protein
VSINELADMIASIAGIRVRKKHVPGPQGVRGRNSDNTRLREVLKWEPQISLEDALERTYRWIEEKLRETVVHGGATEGVLVRAAAGSERQRTSAPGTRVER